MHKILLGTSGLTWTLAAGLAVAAPAVAQEAAADADVGDSAGVAEIVVTAQRRSESLQKAAIAIDAVSGDTLVRQGITSAQDITKTVPALSVANGGGSNTSIFMRGVGNITSSSYNDPAVTPSYDGVVLGRAAGAFGAAFYDLSRVEVLKGPQGILYGRNSTGGAVNIIPARPELGETGAGFNAAYGNFDTLNLDGYVNVATGQNSALRFAATHQEHDGYNRDGSDDQDVTGFRGQFLIEPSNAVTLRIGGDWTRLKGVGPGGSYIGNYNPGPDGYSFAPGPFDSSEGFNTDAANAYRQTLLGAPGFGFLAAMNVDPSVDYTYWGINAEASIDTGIGTFTLLPAYRKTSGSSFFNGPAFNTAFIDETDKQFSVEARLAGSVGQIDYLVGGFYFHETIDANNEYNQEFVLPIQAYHHKTESWAAFGQLTAHLGDRFRLIGGARYTHDFKSMDGIINNFITFCGGLPPGNLTPPASFGAGCAAPGGLPRYPNFLTTGDTVAWLAANGWIDAAATDQPNPQVFPLLNGVGTILKTYNPVVDEGSYSRVTWKVSAEFDLSPDNLLYATVETGYRAGGFQLAEGKSRYDPEFITAYSIGSKNRFLGNRVQLNLEAFYWKYKDQQITYFTVDTSGTLINSNENAGASTIKGFDIDAIIKPARMTTLNAKVQYLDASYDDLHLYTASPRDNINCPYTFTGGVAGGAPVKDFDCSGNPLLYSPKWTINLGAEQIVPLGPDFELVGTVNTAWRDDQYGAFEYLDFERIRAYWTTDLGLTLRSANGGWSIGGYVYNLENERRISTPQRSPIGMAIARYTAPRTYGLRVSAKF